MPAIKKYPLVPEDFEIPSGLERPDFRLRMLRASDVDLDFDAVSSSAAHIRRLNADRWQGWPEEGFTIEENLQDLERHEGEFLRREAFAYTMMSPDEDRCLGCVYIEPTNLPGHDAVVYMWVRKSAFDRGMDSLLCKTAKQWIKEAWPFKNPAYPDREGAC